MDKRFQFLCLFCVVSVAVAIQVEFKDCGSKVGTIGKVDVTPCDNPKFCSLKKGTSSTISVTFSPKEEATNVTAVVHGIVASIPVPFHLPNPNACVQSDLTCPLASGAEVTYSQQLEVKEEYPSLVVVVKWELRDQANNDLACFLLRTKIVA